jgi:hypothetical protein
LNRGGLDLAVNADGFNSVNNPVFSAAGMVPCVPDDSSKESLVYGTANHTFHHNFDGIDVKVSLAYPVLEVSAKTSGLCYVKNIDGQEYAVIKRGLLSLSCIKHDQSCSSPSPSVSASQCINKWDALLLNITI